MQTDSDAGKLRPAELTTSRSLPSTIAELALRYDRLCL
jgi:hypothetical protein